MLPTSRKALLLQTKQKLIGVNHRQFSSPHRLFSTTINPLERNISKPTQSSRPTLQQSLYPNNYDATRNYSTFYTTSTTFPLHHKHSHLTKPSQNQNRSKPLKSSRRSNSSTSQPNDPQPQQPTEPPFNTYPSQQQPHELPLTQSPNIDPQHPYYYNNSIPKDVSWTTRLSLFFSSLFPITTSPLSIPQSERLLPPRGQFVPKFPQPYGSQYHPSQQPYTAIAPTQPTPITHEQYQILLEQLEQIKRALSVVETRPVVGARSHAHPQSTAHPVTESTKTMATTIPPPLATATTTVAPSSTTINTQRFSPLTQYPHNTLPSTTHPHSTINLTTLTHPHHPHPHHHYPLHPHQHPHQHPTSSSHSISQAMQGLEGNALAEGHIEPPVAHDWISGFKSWVFSYQYWTIIMGSGLGIITSMAISYVVFGKLLNDTLSNTAVNLTASTISDEKTHMSVLELTETIIHDQKVMDNLQWLFITLLKDPSLQAVLIDTSQSLLIENILKSPEIQSQLITLLVVLLQDKTTQEQLRDLVAYLLSQPMIKEQLIDICISTFQDPNLQQQSSEALISVWQTFSSSPDTYIMLQSLLQEVLRDQSLIKESSNMLWKTVKSAFTWGSIPSSGPSSSVNVNKLHEHNQHEPHQTEQQNTTIEATTHPAAHVVNNTQVNPEVSTHVPTTTQQQQQQHSDKNTSSPRSTQVNVNYKTSNHQPDYDSGEWDYLLDRYNDFDLQTPSSNTHHSYSSQSPHNSRIKQELSTPSYHLQPAELYENVHIEQPHHHQDHPTQSSVPLSPSHQKQAQLHDQPTTTLDKSWDLAKKSWNNIKSAQEYTMALWDSWKTPAVIKVNHDVKHHSIEETHQSLNNDFNDNNNNDNKEGHRYMSSRNASNTDSKWASTAQNVLNEVSEVAKNVWDKIEESFDQYQKERARVKQEQKELADFHKAHLQQSLTQQTQEQQSSPIHHTSNFITNTELHSNPSPNPQHNDHNPSPTSHFNSSSHDITPSQPQPLASPPQASPPSAPIMNGPLASPQTMPSLQTQSPPPTPLLTSQSQPSQSQPSQSQPSQSHPSQSQPSQSQPSQSQSQPSQQTSNVSTQPLLLRDFSPQPHSTSASSSSTTSYPLYGHGQFSLPSTTTTNSATRTPIHHPQSHSLPQFNISLTNEITASTPKNTTMNPSLPSLTTQSSTTTPTINTVQVTLPIKTIDPTDQ